MELKQLEYVWYNIKWSIKKPKLTAAEWTIWIFSMQNDIFHNEIVQSEFHQ